MTAAAWCERIRHLDTVRRTGRLRAINATALEADGPSVPLGSLVAIEGHGANGPIRVHAEVIRISPDGIVLSSLEDSAGLVAGALVTAIATPNQVRVGQAFLGRAVDALGRPSTAIIRRSAARTRHCTASRRLL
jgi:flagellum-specific ATP synthase